MAGVAARLLEARRCIHGVAEERNLHFYGTEFADDHGAAMQSGAESCPEAEVANVAASALVQLLQASKQARTQCRLKASGEWPSDDDLVAEHIC